MIFNHHKLLSELLDQTMQITYKSVGFKVNFHEADLFELNKNLVNSRTKYPLIWLETGYREQHRVQGSEVKLSNCSFIFVTKGNATDRYSKRYQTSFNDILYPLVAKFEEKIKKTSGISFDRDYHELISLPFNDVSELAVRSRAKRNPENVPLTDIWDALILETDLSISPDCFPQFIIKK